MKSPYEILDVAEQATDAGIKQAYLQKVRAYPPDRDQALFQQIQQAYETIKDSDSRLAYSLFTIPAADFDALLNQGFRQDVELPPLSVDDFMRLLNASPVEKTLLNVFAHK
jgi:DnaJ-class molecular chaperone